MLLYHDLHYKPHLRFEEVSCNTLKEKCMRGDDVLTTRRVSVMIIVSSNDSCT